MIFLNFLLVQHSVSRTVRDFSAKSNKKAMGPFGFTTQSVFTDPEVQDFGVLMYEEYQKPHGKQ